MSTNDEENDLSSTRINTGEPKKTVNDDNVENNAIENVVEQDVKENGESDSFLDNGSALDNVSEKENGTKEIVNDDDVDNDVAEHVVDVEQYREIDSMADTEIIGNRGGNFVAIDAARRGEENGANEENVEEVDVDSALNEEHGVGESATADNAATSLLTTLSPSTSIGESSTPTDIPGAFAVDNPKRENSIRPAIPESNGSSPLPSNQSSNLAVADDINATATATVVFAHRSLSLHSDGDQEDGHHVVEAVCVEGQKVFEARIVTDDDIDDSRRYHSRMMWVYVISALVLLFTMVISLSIVLSGRKQETESNVEEPSKYLERRQALRPILAPLSGDGVFDESSSEFSIDRKNALDWLARDDLLSVGDPSVEWKIRQRYVLALFYYSTNGPEWIDQFYFISGLDECDWATFYIEKEEEFFQYNDFGIVGIICQKNGKVGRIRMWWNNLSGTLPHELSEFSDSLTEIIVGGGSISGTIPLAFAKLTQLETFRVNDHCLSGPIPDFSDAPNLGVLLVNNNDGISGSLNRYCNGAEKKDPSYEIIADCGEFIECDCCDCCDRDIYECCNNNEDTCYQSANLNALSPNNFLAPFDKQCLSEKSKQWVQEECPCYVDKNSNAEDDGAAFEGVCTKDCDAKGANRSYNY